MRSLADYKRIVSYIYQYNHQVKGNNIGFTRLETRNGQCKIIVHVRVPNLQNVTAKVYTYCWYDGELHGVALGDMNLSGGVGEFKLVTQADNLCDTQYSLSDMGGLLVYISDTGFLGAEWDNRPIRFHDLKVDSLRPSDFYERYAWQEESFVESSRQVIKEPVEQPFIEESQEVIPTKEEVKEQVEEEQEVIEQIEEDQEETAYQETEVLDDEEEMQAADFSNKEEEQDDSGPLSRSRMERLDQRAHELFGNILSNRIFETQQEEDQQSDSVVVSPKAAIELFTAFKSCESEAEYQEVEEEIQILYNRIEQLERILKEWRIKENRIKEQRQAKLEAEEEKKQIEEELRKSFHIERAQDIYGPVEADDALALKLTSETESVTQELQEREDSTENQENAWDGEEDAMEYEDSINPVVQRILSKYPVLEPFQDVEPGNCVRIEPQDIGIFPMENWILANNSFLLHGYYSYRHLIFFYKKVYDRPVYLLGIPGVNHSRERFMANMFGFSMFQPLTKLDGENVQAANNRMTGNPAYDEVQGGEFGYWCMEIVF